MKKGNNTYYQARYFLNDDKTATALIISSVATDNSKHYVGSDNEFKISDCSKTIRLDIEIDSEDRYQRTIDKLKMIDEVVNLTLKALALQRMEMTQRQKIIDKADKKTEEK